jgi:hypothetical protein
MFSTTRALIEPPVPEERRAKPRFVITPEIEARALADWKGRGWAGFS